MVAFWRLNCSSDIRLSVAIRVALPSDGDRATRTGRGQHETGRRPHIDRLHQVKSEVIGFWLAATNMQHHLAFGARILSRAAGDDESGI